MKFIKNIIGFLIGFAVVSGIFYLIGGGDKLKGFEPYHSEEGRFSGLFPGQPERELKEMNTPIGTLDFIMYSAGSKKIGFIVGYVDYPQETFKNADIEKMLDGARDGAAQNVNGILENERVLDFHGNPGREIEIKVPKKATIKARVILIGNRLYQVMAVSESNSILEEKSPDFFDSFEVDGT